MISNHHSNLGRKGFIWLMGYKSSAGKPRWENEAGARRKELQQRPWRNTALSGLLSLLFFIQHQTTYLGVTLPTVGWAIPHQSIQKIPHSLVYRKSPGDTFSVRVPSSWMTLTCIKLTKKKKSTQLLNRKQTKNTLPLLNFQLGREVWALDKIMSSWVAKWEEKWPNLTFPNPPIICHWAQP